MGCRDLSRVPLMTHKLLATIGLIVAAGATLCGQQSPTTTPTPAFSYEVASIKPDHLDGHSSRLSVDDNSLVAWGMTVKGLIQYAYNINEFQVSGGPDWVRSETYAIQAKLDETTAEALKKIIGEDGREQRRMLVQALLAERFKLKVTRSSKELATYFLVVTKNGPKFSASADSANTRGGFSNSSGQVTVKKATMSSFADWVSRYVGRKVVDKTGLPGKYDFAFHFTQERLAPVQGSAADSAARPAPPPSDSGPSIFAALQEQLGLKLESQKGPVETLIIDSIERPSEN